MENLRDMATRYGGTVTDSVGTSTWFNFFSEDLREAQAFAEDLASLGYTTRTEIIVKVHGKKS